LKDFKTYLLEDAGIQAKIQNLKSEVNDYASGFPMPGFDDR